MQSLLHVLPDNTHDDVSLPGTAFDFISRPIQRLFLQTPPTLKILLNILDVLAIRFQRQYVGAHTMDWTLTFDTELVFLEDYYHLITPEELALRLTERDKALGLTAKMTSTQSNDITRADRSRCVVDNIIANDDLVHRVLDAWNALSNSVWDCCVAFPNIVPDLENCTEGSIHHLCCFLLNGSCLTKFENRPCLNSKITIL